MSVEIRCYGISAIVMRRTGAGNRVLMLRRATTLAGEWCQVAGKIEAGETAWQAAVREIREETHLIPARLYSAETLEQFYEIDNDAIWVAPVFVAFVDAAQEVRLNEEHSEYRWVPFRKAISMVPFPGQKRVLRHVRRVFAGGMPTPRLQIPTYELESLY